MEEYFDDLPRSIDLDCEPEEQVVRINTYALKIQNAEPGKAGRIARKAIEIASRHHISKQELAKSFSIAGVSHCLQSNYSDAYYFFSEALLHAEQSNSKDLVSRIYFYMGNLHLELGQLKEASEHLMKSLEMISKHPENPKWNKVMNSLGVVFGETGDHKTAIEYFEQVVKNSRNKALLASTLNNMAEEHMHIGDFETALQIVERGLKILPRRDSPRTLTALCLNKSRLLFELRNHTKALKYAMKSLKISRANHFRREEVSTLYLIAEICADMQNFEKADLFYSLANEIIESKNLPLMKSKLFTSMSSYYEKRGFFREALEYYRKAEKMKQSVIREQLEQYIQVLHHKFKVDVLRNRTRILQEKNESLLSEIKLRMAMERKLKLHKEKLEAKNKEKELMLSEIHHRIKNNLAVVSGILDLHSETVNDDISRAKFRDCKMRIQSIAMIHNQLYESLGSNIIHFSEYVQNLVREIFSMYLPYSDNIAIVYDVTDIYIDPDTALPLGLIVTELVTNALKHAFSGKKEGILKIAMYKMNGDVQFTISDNGIGLPDDFSLAMSGTLGLHLVVSLVSQIDGTLKIEKPETGGTVFNILFKHPEIGSKLPADT